MRGLGFSLRDSTVAVALLTSFTCFPRLCDAARDPTVIATEKTEAQLLMGTNLDCNFTVYDEPYSHHTMTANIQPSGVSASQYPYVLVGAKSSIWKATYDVVAIGLYEDVFRPTFSNTEAHRQHRGGFHRGAYWYYYSGTAFGFAPTSKIQLGAVDLEKTDCEERLSWHLDVKQGGFVAGCLRTRSSTWRKVVKYCAITGFGLMDTQSTHLSILRSGVWKRQPPDVTTAPERPVRIGTAVSMDCCSRTARIGQVLSWAYLLFAEWVNTVRDGILIEGVRQPLELILVGDQSVPRQVSRATKYLIDENVQMLLGPVGGFLSEIAARVANESAAVMVLPDASDRLPYMDRPAVFSMALPAQETFAVALAELSRRGATQIAVLKESSFVGVECDAVPALADRYGMTVVWARSMVFDSRDQMNNTLRHISAATPDVLLACADDLASRKLCSELSEHRVDVPAIVFSACFHESAQKAISEEAETLHYVACMTQWSSQMNLSSDITSWSNEIFEYEFRRAYGEQPPHQAASGWASALMLLAAAEMSNSEEPDDVAEALRNIDIETLYGRVHFDENGQNIRSWKALQFFPLSKSFELVAPIEVATQQFAYPMPPWRTRHCFELPPPGRELCAVGMKDGVCATCDETSRALWRPNAWFNISGCLCEPSGCPVGMQLRHGKCESCPVGKYYDNLGECQACAAGHFKSNDYEASCAACPPGKFANSTGATECELCAPGHEARMPASISCDECPRSFFSGSAGSSSCLRCPLGRQSEMEEGSSVCVACQAGQRGNVVCVDCAPGRFQHAVGKDTCEPCPIGAYCAGTGTIWPSNERGWWVLNLSNTGPTFLPCRSAQFCLEGQICKEGHTGVLCEVCLPGYAKTGSSACSKCPDWAFQVVMTILFLIVLVICVYLITHVAVEAEGKPKAISNALLKLLLNYATTLSLTSKIFFPMVVRKIRSESRRAGSMPSTPVVLESFLSLDVIELVWQVIPSDCIFDPATSATDQRWIDALQAASHSDVFESGEIVQALEKLRDLHWLASLYQTIFWLLAPVLFISLVLLIGMVSILFRVALQYSFLKRAIDFFEVMDKDGFRTAQQGHQAGTVFMFFEAHNRRILGLYAPIRYASLLQTSFLNFVREFVHDSQPIAVISTFLVYPTLVQKLLETMRCDDLLEDVQHVVGTQPRTIRSPDVPCYEGDDAIFWLTVFGLVIYILGIPILASRIMYRNRRNLDRHFKRTWGFLMSGYEPTLNFWECVLLLRKSTIVILITIKMYSGTRAMCLLIASLSFSLLHCSYSPFDNRYNQLLDQVERKHLLIWNVFSIGTVWVYIDMQYQIGFADRGTSNLTAVWVVAIVVTILNVYFLCMIVWKLLRRSSEGYAERILHEAQSLERLKADLTCLYDVVEFSTSPGERPKNLQGDAGAKSLEVMAAFKKMSASKRATAYAVAKAMTFPEGRMSLQIWLFSDWAKERLDDYYDRKPHIVCDHVNIWFCLAGKQSHRIVNENIHLRSLAQVKMPSEEVWHPTEMHRRYLVDILMETIEHMICHCQLKVFSPVLLEFVLRIGFTFDEEGRQRAALIQQEIEESGQADAVEAKEQPGKMKEESGSSLRSSLSRSFTRLSGLPSSDLVEPQGELYIALTKTRELRRSITQATQSSADTHGSSSAGSRSSCRASLPGLTFEKTLSPRDDEPLAKRMNSQVAASMMKGTGTVAFPNTDDDEVRGLIKEMFHPEVMMTGISLEELQVNLNIVKMLSEEQLMIWLRIFEEECAEAVQRRVALNPSQKKSERRRVSSRVSIRRSNTGLSNSSNKSRVSMGALRRSSDTLDSSHWALRREEVSESESSESFDPASSEGFQGALVTGLYSLGLADHDDLQNNGIISDENSPSSKRNSRRVSVAQGQERRRNSVRRKEAQRLPVQQKDKQRNPTLEKQKTLDKRNPKLEKQKTLDKRVPGEHVVLDTQTEESESISSSSYSSSAYSSAFGDESNTDSDGGPGGEVDIDLWNRKTTFGTVEIQTDADRGLHNLEKWELSWARFAMNLEDYGSNVRAVIVPAEMVQRKLRKKEHAARERLQSAQEEIQIKRLEHASTMKGAVQKVGHTATALKRDQSILEGTLKVLAIKKEELAHLRKLLGRQTPAEMPAARQEAPPPPAKRTPAEMPAARQEAQPPPAKRTSGSSSQLGTMVLESAHSSAQSTNRRTLWL